MWKNVFIEATILSTVIFGGFYINASLVIKEITVNQKNMLIDNKAMGARIHFSGSLFGPSSSVANISGNTAPQSSISGFSQNPSNTRISGRKT